MPKRLKSKTEIIRKKSTQEQKESTRVLMERICKGIELGIMLDNPFLNHCYKVQDHKEVTEILRINPALYSFFTQLNKKAEEAGEAKITETELNNILENVALEYTEEYKKLSNA